MDVLRVFFFLNCALLPLDKLEEAHEFIETMDTTTNIKEKNRQLKNNLQKNC
jgi:hypothetical protein